MEHLSRVAAFSDKNKMDIRNLAIVFGTVIFGEDDVPKGGDLLSVQNIKVLDAYPSVSQNTDPESLRIRGWTT